MKKIVLFILLISIGITSSIAGYHFCKLTGSIVLSGITKTNAPEPRHDAPIKEVQQCTAGFVLMLPSRQYDQTLPLNNIKIPRGDYYRLIVSQYVANPPFAPPRPLND